MKKIKVILLIFMILVNSAFTAGCWNYREVEKMSIVVGAAIDKGIKNPFQITVEIIQISTGKGSNVTSKTITAEGKTIFDAARNMIALNGRRLYWAHTKIIILSNEVASEGVSKAIEWYNRDSETREDVTILVSERPTAKEILEKKEATDNIKSFILDEAIQNQVSLSKAPAIDIMKFDIESKTKEVSQIIPTVNLQKIHGKIAPKIMGTAIIKNDKLVGFLNANETKDLLFIRNEVKGGILNVTVQEKDIPTTVSLEIFKNKTKITPLVNENNIDINLNIDTTVAIDEIHGTLNFFDDKVQKSLEQNTENLLKKQIEFLIRKVQLTYAADIFGFGAKLQEDKIQVWNSTKDNWEEVFKNLKVNVKTRVHIKNSAVLSEPLKKGD